MNLAEKLETWQVLRTQIQDLEDEIREEVLRLGQSQRVGRSVARYTKGRGSYDYPSIAKELEAAYSQIGPDALAKYQAIVKHDTVATTRIDWRKVCEDAGVDDSLKSKHYTAGEPSVSLAIVEEGQSEW
jgi:hypothetical protein